MSKVEMCDGCSGEIMLFGVRVVVDSMRKSVSLNNLTQYDHRLDHPQPPPNTNDNNAADGYASCDDVSNHSSITGVIRQRKRGVAWTEDEHKLFLQGLEKLGKGYWRGISRNFVKTRTPTQVASHAQKYFLRRTNLNRRRRRSSLFDITTDSIPTNNSQSPPHSSPLHRSPPQRSTNTDISNNVSFSVSPTPIYQFTADQNNRYQQVAAATTTVVDFDLNNSNSSSSFSTFDQAPALSLNLSLSISTVSSSRSTSGMISVA